MALVSCRSDVPPGYGVAVARFASLEWNGFESAAEKHEPIEGVNDSLVARWDLVQWKELPARIEDVERTAIFKGYPMYESRVWPMDLRRQLEETVVEIEVKVVRGRLVGEKIRRVLFERRRPGTMRWIGSAEDTRGS